MNSCMYKLPTFQLTTTVNYNYNKGISVLTSTGLGSQNFVVFAFQENLEKLSADFSCHDHHHHQLLLASSQCLGKHARKFK
jgi:hypothetical protein